MIFISLLISEEPITDMARWHSPSDTDSRHSSQYLISIQEIHVASIPIIITLSWNAQYVACMLQYD